MALAITAGGTASVQTALIQTTGAAGQLLLGPGGKSVTDSSLGSNTVTTTHQDEPATLSRFDKTTGVLVGVRGSLQVDSATTLFLSGPPNGNYVGTGRVSTTWTFQPAVTSTAVLAQLQITDDNTVAQTGTWAGLVYNSPAAPTSACTPWVKPSTPPTSSGSARAWACWLFRPKTAFNSTPRRGVGPGQEARGSPPTAVVTSEPIFLQMNGQIHAVPRHGRAARMDQLLRLRDQRAHNSAALKMKSRPGTQPHCAATTGAGATKVTTAMRDNAAAARAELSAPPMKPSRPK